MAGRLNNKVVLITGTGGGQGRAAAVLFAREGAKVVGCDLKVEGNRDTVRMVKEADGEMISLEPLDLADAAQVQKLVELTDKTYGRLDVLYNNASAARLAPIMELTWEDWEFTIRNELHSLFIMTKAALPLLIRSKGTSIINTASLSGMLGTSVDSVSHTSTKGGVIAFTRQLCVELAPHDIRVNSISPGPIDTPGSSELFKHQEVLDMLMQMTPLRRVGRPEEVAQLALFLASDESSYITGTNMVIDGGRLAM